MYSVLFVCTGNLFRSPIAAEVFREHLTRDGRSAQWKVDSAGTWTVSGRHMPREAVELARSLGVNIRRHKTRMLDVKMLEDADLVLVMEKGHEESIKVEFPFAQKKVYLLSRVLEGGAVDIADPATAMDEAKSILRDLVNRMHAGYGNIYKIAESI